MQCSILGFCGFKYHVSFFCIRSIPEHCDLQTHISNCLLSANRFNFALLQLTLLAYNFNKSVCPERNTKIAGLQTFRTKNICNGLTGDVPKIVLILNCTWRGWQKYKIYPACKEWLVSIMQKSKSVLSGVWKGWNEYPFDLIPIMTNCSVYFLVFQGENIPWYCIWIIYHQRVHMKYRSLFDF